MPGAPRHYRLGIHAGFDLYFAAGTQIQAAADGVVIRADHDYGVAPDPTAFDAWRGQSFDLGYTAEAEGRFFIGRSAGGAARRRHHWPLRPSEQHRSVCLRKANASRGRQIIARRQFRFTGQAATAKRKTSPPHFGIVKSLSDHSGPVDSADWDTGVGQPGFVKSMKPVFAKTRFRDIRRNR